MDVHVPRAITRALVLRGVDVLTAQMDDAARMPDAELLDRAAQMRRVLFSQDEDLLAEATLRQRPRPFLAGNVYDHQLDITIGQCVADLEMRAQCGTPEDFANRVEFLPL